MGYLNFGAMISLQGVRLAFLLVLAAHLPSDSAHSQTVQGGSQSSIGIDDPRPVAKAVEELVSRYGYVITYEDPRHAYEGDLQDVTTQVRKDLDQYPPGKAPKVIVPRGGRLTLALPSSASVSTQSVASVLGQLIRAQSSRGEGGHFRVVQVGEVFHVVPTEVRDRNGNWTAQSSILDVPISLPVEDRSEGAMVDAIAKAVSAEAHVKVYIGGGVGRGIFNPNRPQPYNLGADNERASDVLMRALVLLNDPKSGTWISQRLTWQLLYDSSDNAYFLNIAVVPNRTSSPPVAAPVQKASTDSPAGTSAQQPGINGTTNPNPLPRK